MKLRIKGASLRLRLTQGEIRALAEHGMIEERVPFPHAQLVYRLRRDAAAEQIRASFGAGVVEIRIPERDAREVFSPAAHRAPEDPPACPDQWRRLASAPAPGGRRCAAAKRAPPHRRA